MSEKSLNSERERGKKQLENTIKSVTMKKKVLPFLRRGKENQPSRMPCIVLLLDTLAREFVSIWRKEFHAVQREMLI